MQEEGSCCSDECVVTLAEQLGVCVLELNSQSERRMPRVCLLVGDMGRAFVVKLFFSLSLSTNLVVRFEWQERRKQVKCYGKAIHELFPSFGSC